MSQSLDRFSKECAAYVTRHDSDAGYATIDKHIDKHVPNSEQNMEVRTMIDKAIHKNYFVSAAANRLSGSSKPKSSSKSPKSKAATKGGVKKTVSDQKSEGKENKPKETSAKTKATASKDGGSASASTSVKKMTPQASKSKAPPKRKTEAVDSGLQASSAKISRKHKEIDVEDDLDDFVEYDSDDSDIWEDEEEEDDDEDSDDAKEHEMEGDDLFDIAQFRKGNTIDVEAAESAFQEWKRNRNMKRSKPKFTSEEFDVEPKIEENVFIESKIKLTQNLIERQQEKLVGIDAELSDPGLTKKAKKELENIKKYILQNLDQRIKEIESLKSQIVPSQ